MLVTCPACGTRYEIDGALISPEGRRVQCSTCDHVWQQGPRPAPEPEPSSVPPPAGEAARPAPSPAAPRPAPAPEGSSVGSAASPAGDGSRPTEPAAGTDLGRAPPRQPLADEVRAILREEADREGRVRRERGLLDLEPGLGSSPNPRTRPRTAQRGLPDAERINEGLRMAAQRAAELHRGRRERPGRGGFVAGLVVGLVLVGVAALVYVAAPRIAETVPAAEPALGAYVAAIEDMRATLDRNVSRAATAVADVVDSIR